MTKEDYSIALKDLEEKHKREKNELNREFVKANAKYKVGDTLEDHSSVIKVQVIRYMKWNPQSIPRIIYHGIELRKKDHEPKKSGVKHSIYEDSVLIKHN